MKDTNIVKATNNHTKNDAFKFRKGLIPIRKTNAFPIA